MIKFVQESLLDIEFSDKYKEYLLKKYPHLNENDLKNIFKVSPITKEYAKEKYSTVHPSIVHFMMPPHTIYYADVLIECQKLYKVDAKIELVGNRAVTMTVHFPEV